MAVVVSGVAWGQNPRSGAPGNINYVEGVASIGTQTLSPSSAGSVALAAGQTVTTQAGKVEVLLTPGVFLRVADNSSVKMVSPDLANTEVAMEKGRAAIEVLEIHKENNIRIDLNDTSVKLVDKGLYEFDADHNQVRVFKGKAEVYAGAQKKVTVGGEHAVTLSASAKLKSEGFDTRQYEDDFFRWSALRSGYLSEASADEARVYIGSGPGWYGPGWVGEGWYWDPAFSIYTFLPADGVFYSPFGWGFYSPGYVYRCPFFFNGYYGHQPHVFNDFHYPYGHGFEPPGGFHGGGFHGSAPARGRR